MKKSFRVRCTDATTQDPTSLLPRIVEETGSEAEAASILRSIERLGTDPSILFYEMTKEMRGPRSGGTASTAWRVRADRGAPPVTEVVP